MIEKITRMNDLYDYYHALLTPRQKEYFELYYHTDHSLGEIADQFEVSRTAVLDSIKRTEKSLEAYELKLLLLAAAQKRLDLLEEILELGPGAEVTAKLLELKQLDGFE